MKVLLSLMLFFSVLFSSDATIDVVKRVDTLPSLGIESSSSDYNDVFKMKFFKSLVADLNVISLFNVDRHFRENDFDSSELLIQNKDMNYVLKYRLLQEDSGALHVDVKLIHNDETILNKSYRVGKQSIYVFISHAIAYDVNNAMDAPSVAWMKKKVIFSRIVAPKKSEIVIADYTLTYQHTILTGGFNIFPKWANKAQTAFYYTALDGSKPTLKHIDIKTAKITKVLSSDGMIVCSDVSEDKTKLLLTMAPKGQTDIYMYDVATKRYKKLTNYGGIDVNGQFLGQNKIVFISDRLGYPNVFSKDIGSTDVEQMVYYGRSNSACSVHGNYIVYKARESSNAFSKNTFNLHLISTESDFIRRLTAVGMNEFPRFSDDGDAILFIKNYKQQSAIGIIRLNYNKNYLFPLKSGRIQSMDW